MSNRAALQYGSKRISKMQRGTADLRNHIPQDLLLKARVQAILQDKTMPTWIAEAIQEKLDREQNGQKEDHE